MTIENLDLNDPLMTEIRELAKTAAGHRLAPHMLGGQPLTRPSALMVRQRLADHQPATAWDTLQSAEPTRSVQFVTPSGRNRPSWEDLASQIPAGRYAVPSATGHNDLDFYLVQVPQRGKYTGRTFVKRIIGGHDPMQMSGREQYRALAQITDFGIEEAGMKYALESGNCRDCGRELTDEESRAAGKGPVCRSK